jgi:DNA-binding response OmpR family regulator
LLLHWLDKPVFVTGTQKQATPYYNSAGRELVLIVDPDDKFVRDITGCFREANLDVATAKSGDEAWKYAIHFEPAIIVTEVELPKMSGFDLCRRLKSHRPTTEIPLVFVTERDQEIDRVVGFELGATDYVIKPVNQRELTLRVLRILKRLRGYDRGDTMRLGRLVVDFEQSTVYKDGQRLNLSPTEFQIFAVLARAQGRVLTRNEIINRAWRDRKSVMVRTVDAHIKSLRPKLEKTGFKLVTIRRAGYCLRYYPPQTSKKGEKEKEKGPERTSVKSEAHGQERLRESSGI